ncbi:DUF418 domain-containing protein [Acidipila sp. EB88]|uniref:DUF418 domain-containing protein n=1 Tax=Acidipila sp. EB88 TaxID=2305226 RepID=UPI000F5E3E19|nr:DUF418 domain-containing protein [Acidipila sp. EB88]RRA48872.1 DUF418 domain-containing protein [Acidipila sp. EB88]
MRSETYVLDQSPVRAGAPEELAGPAPIAEGPVSRSERIGTLDVLRGFALMGILLMTIPGFSLPEFDNVNPITMIKPVFSGPHWHVNTAIWFARWIFAEGRMRALFSMLFGAGVILLTSRAESRGAGVRTADIFTRRNMWLVVFGLVHSYLIWFGDILYPYGIFALLFLFPLRHLKAKTLLWAGVVLLSIQPLVLEPLHVRKVLHDHAAAVSAYAARDAHQSLSAPQQGAIATWEAREAAQIPTRASLYQDIAAHHGYLAAQKTNAPIVFGWQTTQMPRDTMDVLSMMLIGMGLFRNGFLVGRLRARTYLVCALVGLGVAWPLAAGSTWYEWHGHFELLHTLPQQLTFQVSRLFGAIGNAALVILLVKRGIFRPLLGRMAAIGQTALSNYLLTSILMQWLFVWGPLHWYGMLEYYQLYLVVLGMWLINLTVSPVWLRHFRFGPVEWLWRSLTYWKRQPMRLTA